MTVQTATRIDPRARIGPVERLLILQRAPGFRYLTSDDLVVLAENARERIYRKNEIVYDPDHPSRTLGWVVEGRIQVDRNGEPVVTVKPGWAIGGFGILSEPEPDTRAYAVIDTLVLEMRHEVMFEIMEDRFSLMYNMIRVLAEGIEEMLDQLPLGNIQKVPLEPRASRCNCPNRPLDLVERIFFLRLSPVYGGASLEVVAEVAERMTEIRYEAGDVVWREGDRSASLLWIVDGELAGTKVGRDGADIYRPGSVAGAPNAVIGKPRRETLTVTKRVMALEMSRELFFDVIEDDHELAMQVARMMVAFYRELQFRLADRRRDEAWVTG